MFSKIKFIVVGAFSAIVMVGCSFFDGNDLQKVTLYKPTNLKHSQKT